MESATPSSPYSTRPYKRGRALVMAEAAVEYFIHLCVTTTFLTAILNEMEVGASLQGLIGAITSLACIAQLLAVFRVKKTYPCKRWVSLLNLVSQLLFTLLYLMPLSPLTPTLRLVCFVGLLLAAYLCQHYLTPSRVSWHMALVDDNKRGRFTAKKEIISLAGGMVFSQTAGILLDHFKAKGDMRTCFFLFIAVITVLSLLHLVIMLLTAEPVPEKKPPVKSFGEILDILHGSRDLRRVILFDILYAISCISIHYYTVYLTNTWHCTYTYITAVAVGHACFRALVSPFLGRLADRRSWAYMLRICMLVMAVGYLVFAAASGSTILWLYPLFSLCYAFSLGGSNAGRTNLCLDYVTHEDRRYVLGIQSSVSGVISFLCTIPVSFFVEWLEGRGNTLFGYTVYPQQVLFAVSSLTLILLALCFLPKLSRPARVIADTADTNHS